MIAGFRIATNFENSESAVPDLIHNRRTGVIRSICATPRVNLVATMLVYIVRLMCVMFHTAHMDNSRKIIPKEFPYIPTIANFSAIKPILQCNNITTLWADWVGAVIIINTK